MKCTINSFCVSELGGGDTAGYIFPGLINGGDPGRGGVSKPPGVLGESSNELLWQIYAPPPFIYAHDKVPLSPPQHLLEMSLYVRL